MLALLIVAKPALRIATSLSEIHHQYSAEENVKSFASSRTKYDTRVVRIVVNAHGQTTPPIARLTNIGYLRTEPVLLGIITARHLLNIHFRILPERKIFLQQGKLTV